MKTKTTQKINDNGNINNNKDIGASAPLETVKIVIPQTTICPIIHITGAIRNPK